MTLKQEIGLWEQIKKSTKKGTDGYKEAVKQLTVAKKEFNESLKKLNEDYISDVKDIKDKLK